MKHCSSGLNDFSLLHGLSMVGRWWLAVMLLALAFAQMWSERPVCVLWNSVQFLRLMWRSKAAWPRWLLAAWCWWLVSRASEPHRWYRWGWHWMSGPLRQKQLFLAYDLSTSNRSNLTGFLVNLASRMWHWCGTTVFLCAVSLEAWSSLCLPPFLSPCLSSSSPAPDGEHSGEDTGKGRCVYLPETKCCAVADGNALEQAVHSDTTVTLQWSLYCRENSFSLNIALTDLFVGFRIWWYKPCHQNLFPPEFCYIFIIICGIPEGLTLALCIYLNCI